MKIVLVSVQQDLHAAYQKHCGNLDFVECSMGNITTYHADSVVSPANSFGFMDGGIDQVYTNFFGPLLQERVQQSIQIHHDGELLVGEALAVPTGNDQIRHLICAPTMRVPAVVTGTMNAYLAARAALKVAQREAHRTVLIPGLGTGTGQLPAEVCAKQVRLAIDNVLLEVAIFPKTIREARLFQAHYTQ